LAQRELLVSASFALSFTPLGSSMSIAGIGSSTASLPPPELLPAAATAARPDGTSGGSATGMPFVPSAHDTIDDSAALLIALAASLPDDTANLIKAAFAPFLTAIGALIGNFAQRTALAAANAAIEQEVAGLQHQLEQSGTDLTAAQAKLADDEKLDQSDPANQALVAADQANIAAIQANIAGFQQSIDQDQGQSASNTAQIAVLETAALTGFALIASAIVQRISEEQQKAGTRNQAEVAALGKISDDLRSFLDNEDVAKVLRLVQQRAEDDAVSARVAAAATGQATDAKQIPPNNPAVPVSQTAPDQEAASNLATSNTVVPAIDPPLTVQIPTRLPAPADDPSGQKDEQADIAAAEVTRPQQQQADPENAVEPVPAHQISQAAPPQRPPQNPVADINANAGNTERAALQKGLTGDPAERSDRNRLADARASDIPAQRQNTLMAEVTKKADELATKLDRLVNRFVKPSAATLSTASSSTTPWGNGLTVASLQNQETPGRWKIPV
jgi:hypothetical protein